MDYNTIERYVSRLEIGSALSENLDDFDAKVEETYDELVDYAEEEVPDDILGDFLDAVDGENYDEALEIVDDRPSWATL